ncbi:hypothetical protein B0H66DRAFT_286780 [Apodospora peruviana]|uniref:Uncharacterized protein n=1 Tax=Apodospora peruviana TaxID=516989 RepID=A0AAE0I0C3_9PEZI|nr:hypothetical protein B0H66DRAFT_286780 [Apodospora peruviana]
MLCCPVWSPTTAKFFRNYLRTENEKDATYRWGAGENMKVDKKRISFHSDNALQHVHICYTNRYHLAEGGDCFPSFRSDKVGVAKGDDCILPRVRDIVTVRYENARNRGPRRRCVLMCRVHENGGFRDHFMLRVDHLLHNSGAMPRSSRLWSPRGGITGWRIAPLSHRDSTAALIARRSARLPWVSQRQVVIVEIAARVWLRH